MEANIDNFINYTESPSLFLCENFPELDFGFRSPETEISLTNNPPATTPSHSSDPSHQFSNAHSARGPSSNTGSDHRSPDTMTSSPDDESRYMSTGTHISSNSKKIQKRNKEEKKVKAKQELEQLLATTARKYIPEGIDDPNLDEKTKRKMVQMVKNRVAAQKTRDKRKGYMSELEEVKSRLDEANRQLNERNRLLEQRVRDLECAQSRLMAENEELKRGNQYSSRSMQQQAQHPMYPPQQQQIHHPHMQPPHPQMQPMMNSPHYPSLPSTPQHLMQPRFQSMTSMTSFDGFAFPQSNTRLNPHPNSQNINNNNSHTTITIDDSQNNSNGNGNGNGNGNQQFTTPFPVLSRGSSGKRNMYGYLLAITMVLACFTTLNIETGKIVHKGSPFAGPEPSDPSHSPNDPPGADPNTGFGPGDSTGGTDSGGTESGGTGTGTGTDTGTGTNTGGSPQPQPSPSNGNDPTVATDVATNNGTGTKGNNNGGRSPKSEGTDESGNGGNGGSVNTLFSEGTEDDGTGTGTDDGTGTGTETNNGKTDETIQFNTLDTNTTNTNTNSTTPTSPLTPARPTNRTNTTSQIPSRSGLIRGQGGVGRMLLTEILDEIDALNKDY